MNKSLENRDDIIEMVKTLRDEDISEEIIKEYLEDLDATLSLGAATPYSEFGLAQNALALENRNLLVNVSSASNTATMDRTARQKKSAGLVRKFCVGPQIILCTTITTVLGEIIYPSPEVETDTNAIDKLLEALKVTAHNRTRRRCDYGDGAIGGFGEEEAEAALANASDEIERKRAQLKLNKARGYSREKIFGTFLRAVYPCDHVLRERYLRDKDPSKIKGKMYPIFKDRETGTGRRVDFVVVHGKTGETVRVIEVTSVKAYDSSWKKKQVEKEERIREDGGTIIQYPAKGFPVEPFKAVSVAGHPTLMIGLP